MKNFRISGLVMRSIQ